MAARAGIGRPPRDDLRHHWRVTDRPSSPDPASTGRASLPPDPVQYDSERNVHARKRGLMQPYIAGGNDPELAETLRRERRYVRILVLMAGSIIALGVILGLISALVLGPGT
jgi:hypothetical protein